MPRLQILHVALAAVLLLSHAHRASAAEEVTDAQVVASMQKGIDFLLAQKTADNWEGVDHSAGMPWAVNKGGMTAIALYALLHAGDGLQDDPVYHSKLYWRGKELAPAIAWLSKNVPTGTYTAGLEASALTLLPKLPDEKPGEGTRDALEACKWYALMAMAPEGGYSYTPVVDIDQFKTAWNTYVQAAARGDPSGAALTALKAAANAEYGRFGGPELALHRLAQELNQKKSASKDAREIANLDAQLRALDNFSRMVPAPPPSTKTPAEKDTVAFFGDLSNGQYGTLGAWALADYGIELPMRYWEVQDRFWRKMQNPDGGWFYAKSNSVTTSTMGVAGIASLFVCQEFLDNDLRLIPKPDKNIDAGLAWLVQDFKPRAEPYYLYGVERVGLSSGLKFFGTTDWYKQGAAAAVKAQAADGSWSAGYPFSHTDATAYMLLFLARGRNPVAFNKLQYNGYWNARPHDDAYITRWMSKRFEKPINWQSVNLSVSPDEWQDAPVLLITGSEDPKFSKEEIDKLRAYINAGGMIFSSADGAKPNFTNAIKKIAADVVNDKYEMRQLPKDHALFSKELGVDLPNPPQLLGMSNGSREIWIHSPQDVGADWQTRKYSSKNFELGAALYLYASGMASLRSKLQPLTVAEGAESPAHTVNVALLDYSGNSEPEPGAWPRMAKLARADFKTQVNLSTVKFAELDPKKFSLAHLTGTAVTTFAPDDVKSLKAYLDGGGMLLIDPASGSEEFANSAQALIKQLYPDTPLAPLPQDHPLYLGSFPDGQKIGDIELRKFATQKLQRKVTAPDLQQIAVNGKTKIIFSPYDMASGFLGTNTWGILGYAPKSSEALARNILLYSLNPAGAK